MRSAADGRRAEQHLARPTPSTSPWSWAPAGSRPPTRSARPRPRSRDRAARVPAAGRCRPRRADQGRSRSARKRALVFLGRTHLYEGHGVAAVVARRPYRGRGRLQDGRADQRLRRHCAPRGSSVGEPVLDQRPPQPDRRTARSSAPRFVDLTDVYSPRLRALAKEVDPSLDRGRVRRSSPGRTTRPRPRSACARSLGGDLVGMSTVLEAIAAREGGAEVLGISLVTNLGRRAGRRAAEPRRGAGGRPRPPPTRMGGLLGRLVSSDRTWLHVDGDGPPRKVTTSRRPRAARPGWPQDPDPETRAELSELARERRRRDGAGRAVRRPRWSSAPPGLRGELGAGPTG